MARTDHFFGATDTGRQRSNNEDAFIAQPLGANQVLACVIDGVGGYEGGEVAASIAREIILENFRQPAADIILKMKSGLVQANQKIYEERQKNPDLSSMACVLTLVIADLENNQLYYAHVGDTRLYLFRDNSLVKLTRDHSFVGFLEDNKRISEEEAMAHPKRNEINKALGFDPNLAGIPDYIDTGHSPFLPGDLLMLCSDGLTDLVDNQSMTRILNDGSALSEKTNRLIEAANDAGGKDNITVVMVANNKKSARQKATKPTLLKKNEEPLTQAQTAGPKPEKKKKGNGLLLFLILLILVLIAVIYYLWNRTDSEGSIPESSISVPTLARNASEKRMIDSLEVSPILFLDSSFGNSIIITDSVRINNDSLYINGNGLTLRSDSSYQGPLFITGEECNYVLLENLTIDGFSTGLSTFTDNVRLRNVTFINTSIPVQFNVNLPEGRPLNGIVVDSLLFKKDTIN